MYFLKNKNSHGNEAPTKKKQTQLIPWKSSTLKDYDYNIPIAATVVSSVSIVFLIITLLISINNMDTIENWIIVMVISTLFPSFTMPINLALTLRSVQKKKPLPKIPKGPVFYDDIGPDPNNLPGPNLYPPGPSSSTVSTLNSSQYIQFQQNIPNEHPIIPRELPNPGDGYFSRKTSSQESGESSKRSSTRSSVASFKMFMQQKKPMEYPNDYDIEIKTITKQEGLKVPTIRLEPLPHQLNLPPRPLMDPKVLFKVATLVHNTDEPLEEQEMVRMNDNLVKPFRESDEEQSSKYSSLAHSVDLELCEKLQGCLTKQESIRFDIAGDKIADQERHSGIIIQVKSHRDNYNRKLSLQ